MLIQFIEISTISESALQRLRDDIVFRVQCNENAIDVLDKHAGKHKSNPIESLLRFATRKWAKNTAKKFSKKFSKKLPKNELQANYFDIGFYEIRKTNYQLSARMLKEDLQAIDAEIGLRKSLQ